MLKPIFGFTTALIMCSLLGTSAVSKAQSTLSESTSVTATFTALNQAPQPIAVSLGQFDTMGGTRVLTGITFAISPDATAGQTAAGTLTVNNSNRNAKPVAGDYAEKLSVKLATTVLATGTDSTTFSGSVAAHSSASETLLPLDITATGMSLDPTALPSPLSLSDFEGNGTITDPGNVLRLVIDDQTDLTTHADITVGSYSSTTTETVTVTYTYTTVPEPGSLTLLVGLSLTGAGLLAHRRK